MGVRLGWGHINSPGIGGVAGKLSGVVGWVGVGVGSPDFVSLDIRKSIVQHLTVNCNFNVLEMTFETIHFVKGLPGEICGKI